ncbi:MAG TPA: DinB family protein, partial [Rhodothermales bacterium]|nr:DinB family protein [Rhodothermales bacterium]
PVDEDEVIAQKDWNAQAIDAILEQVQAARRALVDWLRALPPDDWHRTGLFDAEHYDVYAVAHYLTQHDADLLRTIGYRLHETNLTDRSRDLPK